MSTRSRIGRKNDDGTVTSIYVHFDGYIAGVGQTLAKHYTDPAKIDALIALGDASSLGAECENPPAGHSYSRPADGYTVFYGRDRGEEHVAPRTHSASEWPDSNPEYLYLWDGAAWMVKEHGDDWRKLDAAIAEPADAG